MDKREIVLFTIGLPIVIMLGFLMALFIIVFGDPYEEYEEC